MFIQLLVQFLIFILAFVSCESEVDWSCIVALPVKCSAVWRLIYFLILFFCRFAFLDFESADDARKIIKSMNGHTIDGRPIKLDFAQERGSGE